MKKGHPVPQDIPYCDNFRDTLDLVENLFSERTAFSFKKNRETVSVSYRRFCSEARSFAAFLISSGHRGEKIALLGRNSYEWILTYFACVCSGNIILPTDCTASIEQICDILTETDAKMLFISDEYSDYGESLKKVFPQLEIFSLDSDVQKMINKGEKADSSVYNSVEVKTDDLAAIIYTSGTTGLSKGVMLTHGNLCSNHYASYYGTRVCLTPFLEEGVSEVKNLLVLPLHHTYCFNCVVMTILWGVNIFIGSMKNLSRDLLEQQPDLMFAVPVVLGYFHKRIWENAAENNRTKALKRLMVLSNLLLKLGIDMRKKFFKPEAALFGGKLRIGQCGGAAANSDLIKELEILGIEFSNGYGTTECSPVIAVESYRNGKAGSVGKLLPGVKAKIDCRSDETDGEILVKSKSVFKGYYNNPELTEKSFDADGYFKTGDIGHIDKDGFVFITGRKKNMIVLSNGKNVYPEELEAKLMKNPAIKEILIYEKDNSIAAEIFPDKNYLKSRSVFDEKSYFDGVIRQFNADEPPYKNIGRIIIRDTEFPRTSSMKIKRSN